MPQIEIPIVGHSPSHVRNTCSIVAALTQLKIEKRKMNILVDHVKRCNVCWSVGRLVGWSVGWSVCHNYLKGQHVTNGAIV